MFDRPHHLQLISCWWNSPGSMQPASVSGVRCGWGAWTVARLERLCGSSGCAALRLWKASCALKNRDHILLDEDSAVNMCCQRTLLTVVIRDATVCRISGVPNIKECCFFLPLGCRFVVTHVKCVVTKTSRRVNYPLSQIFCMRKFFLFFTFLVAPFVAKPIGSRQFFHLTT